MSEFKIAVMGFGPTSEEAPIGDPSWKIFGLPWDDKYKYFHNLYEMHSKPVMELSNALVLSERWTGTEVETICHRPRNYPKILLEISENKNQTLYCQEAYFPGCLAYPFDKVIPFTGDYFISSVAYMLAHAISMRPDVLAVYGIDLQDDHEWDYQRACVEYMLGLARGMGTKIIIPEGSALLKLDKIAAESVLTPRSVIFALQKDQKVGEVMEQNKMIAFSRIPIFNTSLDDIVGIVHRYELLNKLSHRECSNRIQEGA